MPTTPINIENLEDELIHHPDQHFVNFLISGLRYGFDIGYFGPDCSRISRNLLSADKSPLLVDEYLKKEVEGGRIFGPFPSPPFENFQCHPIGIVPKKTPGKFRSITDLSSLVEKAWKKAWKPWFYHGFLAFPCYFHAFLFYKSTEKAWKAWYHII